MTTLVALLINSRLMPFDTKERENLRISATTTTRIRLTTKINVTSWLLLFLLLVNCTNGERVRRNLATVGEVPGREGGVTDVSIVDNTDVLQQDSQPPIDISAITASPSFQPTSPPTSHPSSTPTATPTAQKSGNPTTAPSPTPTERPSLRPSQRPTSQPTYKPSDAPSHGPTSHPTNTPSTLPSYQPSKLPTLSPSSTPSKQPTITPSIEPTITTAPSLSPSPAPSVPPTTSPSMRPSPTPSEQPSPTPSSSPSFAPTLTLQNSLVEVLMTMFPFSGETELRGQNIITWETATAAHVRKHVLLAGVEPELYDLQVGTNIVGQSLPRLPQNNNENSGQRLLQITEQQRGLTIKFDVAVSYRSLSLDHDIPALVFEAWDTAPDRVEYVQRLQQQAGGDVFDSLETVQLQVEGFTPSPANDNGPTDDKKVGIALIVGSAVGGAALIFLIVFFVVRHKSGSVPEQGIEQSRTTTDARPKIAVSTEILVEPQDDISTLGDPMFAPGGMLIGGLEKDEVTASVGDDYDYVKQYRHAAMRNGASVTDNTSSREDRLTSEDYTKESASASGTFSKLGLSHMGESLFADDLSFEQQFAEPEERFDVVAPAGKLGMVIDTPNGGVPVVHAIKDTSVLADRVRVGDRLISVDGDDCTGLTAMQVSKLISLKSEKPSRILVFVRSRANATGMA